MVKNLKKAVRLSLARTEMALVAKGMHVRSGLVMPDFLGIGSPISASTWLAANLDRHPEVSVSKEKETDFFSRNLSRGLGWYSSQFEGCSGRVVGEYSPSYGRLPVKRISLIRSLQPGLRLIMTIRHPVDRAWAGARRTMSMMSKHLGCRFEDVPKSEFYKYFEIESEYNKHLLGRGGDYDPDLKSGDYCKILDNWSSVFPESQILVIFYDDIKSNPRKVLCEAFGHLGVSSDVDFSDFLMEPVNSNRKMDMPDWARVRLEGMYRAEVDSLKKRFGDRLPRWD